MSNVGGWELVSPYPPMPSRDPHPIDGDPNVVEHQATLYRQLSVAIQEAREGLIAATNPHSNISEAVWAFAALAREVKADLDKIDARYQVMSEKMAGYAGVLRSERAHAEHAFAAAQEAERRRRRAHRRWIDADLRLNNIFSPPENPLAVERERQNAENDRDHAEYEIGVQRTAVLEAIARRSDHAARAAEAIRVVIDNAPLNDGVLDKIGDFFAHTLLDWFESIVSFLDQWGWLIDLITIIVTVLALVLVLTGVGAPLGVLLQAINIACKALKALSLGVKILKATAVSWLWAAGRLPFSAVVAVGIDIALDAALGKVGSKIADNATVNGWVMDTIAKSASADIHLGAPSGAVAAAIDTAFVKFPETAADWIGDAGSSVILDFGVPALAQEWTSVGEIVTSIEPIESGLDQFGEMYRQSAGIVPGPLDPVGNLIGDIRDLSHSHPLDGSLKP